MPLLQETGQVDGCMVPAPELTSQTKFAMYPGENEVPGPNIVVSTPIARLSKPGGPAVVDAHHPRSPTLLLEAVCH